MHGCGQEDEEKRCKGEVTGRRRANEGWRGRGTPDRVQEEMDKRKAAGDRHRDGQKDLQEARSSLFPSAKAKVTAVWFSSSCTYANICKWMHNYGDCTHLAPGWQEAHVPFTWEGRMKS